MTSLAFSPDSHQFICLVGSKKLLAWDLSESIDPQCQPVAEKIDAECDECQFSPDGSAVLLGSEDGLVRIHEPTTLHEVDRVAGK